MATPNLTEIVTTTLRNRTKKLADNVSDNNALLARLKKRGNIKLKSGGRNLVQELDYAENSTFKRYSGYETLDISPSEVLTAAEFDWKQAAVAVSISGLEQLQNSGRDAVIDLLDARITNAERTMMNQISADIYSDGTASSSKQIGGLQLLVADDPTTGTVGGINRATYSFWRNQVFDATTDGTATSASTIQGNMNGLYVQLIRGTDKPDLVIADNTYYEYYLNSLQLIQRIADSDMANLGFQTVKYLGSDVVLDGGVGGNCPASHMYFLNTNYIHFCTHRDRNFSVLEPDRFAVNQDAMVKLIAWAGNMTLSNASLQGVYKE